MVALPAVFSRTNFNYVDILVVVWLVAGLIHGRRSGMTQQLLPMLQWVAIVIVAGLFYQPFSLIIKQYAQFDQLWSSILAYLMIGFGVHLVYLWTKHLIQQKLVGSDLFGRAEYYFGMIAGMVAFACMLIVACALMNSRIYTRAELASDEKAQSDAFSDIRFPTFGSIQQEVLFQSYSGCLIRTNLHSVLIASVAASPQKGPTLAHKREELIDEVIGTKKR
ncbi:MAG TPA: CvpA family protein [Verrucomicrobiae bacterium]|jgi:uncharacterized membrane protein required for colicin V production|nr:CvpA family protein [Verrucomicrobiae bacterium]